ncbi:hypothetical protein CSKR_100700 [Clonorchis sinensis]|uniref:Uncharacterized protein n=1 Tax=Clonorchis sinensis TaxID=79923 RepID=A0A3R7CV95_CLOSI|nr:hypothetical protein CSKR_100700 [Clonorchis sinensis]
MLGVRWPKCLEREFTDRKVRVSNPTSASRLSLYRLWKPGSILALVSSSGGMTVTHRKGATAERFFLKLCLITKSIGLETAQWLRRQLTDQKVYGSNPTSASRLLLSRFGKLGSRPAPVLPSVCMTARQQKGAAAERK